MKPPNKPPSPTAEGGASPVAIRSRQKSGLGGGAAIRKIMNTALNRSLAIFILIFSIVSSRADFVIQEKTYIDLGVTNFGNCVVTIKIKGDKIRTDSVCDPSGSISLIMDLNTGESTELLPDQKQAVKSQINNAAAKIAPPKLQDTGKAETVAGYTAEVYTWTNNNSGGTVWVAKDFPNFAKIQPQFEKMSQDNQPDEPDAYALGMVIKVKTYEEGALNPVMTLASVNEEPVDPSAFEIPKDYHIISQ
jgi:hypothetical protein